MVRIYRITMPKWVNICTWKNLFLIFIILVSSCDFMKHLKTLPKITTNLILRYLYMKEMHLGTKSMYAQENIANTKQA